MSSNLRQILQDCLHPLPNNITVGTSAGIDSASLVLSALDIGKQVSIISFTLEDRSWRPATSGHTRHVTYCLRVNI